MRRDVQDGCSRLRTPSPTVWCRRGEARNRPRRKGAPRWTGTSTTNTPGRASEYCRIATRPATRHTKIPRSCQRRLRTPTATRRLESCKFRREVSGRIRSPASHAPRTCLARALHVATPSPCPSRPAMLRPAAHDDGSPRVSSSSSPQYVSRTPRIANSVTCHGSSDSDSSRFGWRAHR